RRAALSHEPPPERRFPYPNARRRVPHIRVPLHREPMRLVGRALGLPQPLPRLVQLGTQLSQLLGAPRRLRLRRSLRRRRRETLERVESLERQRLRELAGREELTACLRDGRRVE